LTGAVGGPILGAMTETTTPTNHWGQPIGRAVPNWAPPPRPPMNRLSGRYCFLEPFDAGKHARALYAALADAEGRRWTYLPCGPFATADEYSAWMSKAGANGEILFYSICSHAGEPLGVAGYMRIDVPNGSIEVGHVNFSAALQRTAAATEAMHLMMAEAFRLGYRRYEWKCDSLHATSRAAALRLGFVFEGIFRQAVVYKGRSRDTAWFSVIDRDWPRLKWAHEKWLAPENFDVEGRQRTRLSAFVSEAAVNRGQAA
jgi:RimJ/RimL family protein N-acetyltransferase